MILRALFFAIIIELAIVACSVVMVEGEGNSVEIDHTTDVQKDHAGVLPALTD